MDLPVNLYATCWVDREIPSQVQAERNEETLLTRVLGDHAVRVSISHLLSLCTEFHLIFSGSFAPPTLQGMGMMAGCHAESASNEKNPGCLGYQGDCTTQFCEDPY